MTTNFTKGFSEAEKLAVWNKGGIDPQYIASTWRYDRCGAWMKWDEYGNRDSKYGWEIDHIKAVANGGTDDISNLQPLHWKNNLAKGDGKLECVVGTGNL